MSFSGSLPANTAATGASTRRKTLEIGAVVVLAIFIAAIFWDLQRYPALFKKLHAGPAIQVSGSISFDALLPVKPAMPLPVRVGRTAVNWLWTNRFGMYFAIPFGAAMMTLLAQIERKKQFRHAATNVLCGAVAGAPLGVCANCATPVGQSLLAAGTSSRLTVAAMISSPSFNPVVLAMVFALFPAQMAIARVVVPALLLLALPLLVREREPQPVGMRMPEPAISPAERAWILTRSFLQNLLRLTWMTLPWMLLAALIGALAAETIPAYGTHLPVSVFGIIAVAILGTVLPVPMAFDVGLAWVLYRSGVPTPYVAALLCTLGPVSAYSLMALGKELGPSVPLKLAAATAFLGIVAGLWMMVR
jgi:uncharacterized membrane protein YraQ (UPF0718 family)